MSRSWREWNKYTSGTPRKWNRKDRRGSGVHCCKMHHDWYAAEFDQLRDLRENKRGHEKEMRFAKKGGYTSA